MHDVEPEQDHPIPTGFLRLSDATALLAKAMFGGLPRPVHVVEVKRIFGAALSVQSSEWGEEAKQRVSGAALKGTLPIYVAPVRVAQSRPCCRWPIPEPMRLTKTVLERMFTSRKGLSNHPIRPSLKTTGGDKKLLALLLAGVLVVHEREFTAWLRAEYARGKWPSQRARSKARRGRPTKQTDELRTAIVALVRHDEWSVKNGIAALHRKLVAAGHAVGVSDDTLSRLVNRLFLETGDPKFFRKPRPKRR